MRGFAYSCFNAILSLTSREQGQTQVSESQHFPPRVALFTASISFPTQKAGIFKPFLSWRSTELLSGDSIIKFHHQNSLLENLPLIPRNWKIQPSQKTISGDLKGSHHTNGKAAEARLRDLGELAENVPVPVTRPHSWQSQEDNGAPQLPPVSYPWTLQMFTLDLKNQDLNNPLLRKRSRTSESEESQEPLQLFPLFFHSLGIQTLFLITANNQASHKL